MRRNKKIVIQCHCLLNCNSKVEGSSEYEGALDFNKKLIEDGFGIIQLPCPELLMYGINRWGHSKEQFDNIIYREKCRELLLNYIHQMKMYIDNAYEIKGIIAIDGSPSCGYNKTCSSKRWYGELSGCKNLSEKIGDIKSIEGKGVFIEELVKLLDEYTIDIPIFGIDESRLEESINDVYKKLY
ncbi:CD3072 family TudS-related putative desulfidase [Metaclostridioides mangenotii]|uniref:CD3072 family TudS-related putative desulfidase n=1 Tax=Metaclostridioides mangenotii TaxID=1540 RepID=UPI000463701F|nr:CD3072 family TudS-related putative desulfidase [Clostridioides mangenotii]